MPLQERTYCPNRQPFQEWPHYRAPSQCPSLLSRAGGHILTEAGTKAVILPQQRTILMRIFTPALPVGSAEAVVRPETQQFPSIPNAALIPIFPPGLLTPGIILKKYLSRQTPSEDLLRRKPNQWFLYIPSEQILAKTYPASIYVGWVLRYSF